MYCWLLIGYAKLQNECNFSTWRLRFSQEVAHPTDEKTSHAAPPPFSILAHTSSLLCPSSLVCPALLYISLRILLAIGFFGFIWIVHIISGFWILIVCSACRYSELFLTWTTSQPGSSRDLHETIHPIALVRYPLVKKGRSVLSLDPLHSSRITGLVPHQPWQAFLQSLETKQVSKAITAICSSMQFVVQSKSICKIISTHNYYDSSVPHPYPYLSLIPQFCPGSSECPSGSKADRKSQWGTTSDPAECIAVSKLDWLSKKFQERLKRQECEIMRIHKE